MAITPGARVLGYSRVYSILLMPRTTTTTTSTTRAAVLKVDISWLTCGTLHHPPLTYRTCSPASGTTHDTISDRTRVGSNTSTRPKRAPRFSGSLTSPLRSRRSTAASRSPRPAERFSKRSATAARKLEPDSPPTAQKAHERGKPNRWLPPQGPVDALRADARPVAGARARLPGRPSTHAAKGHGRETKSTGESGTHWAAAARYRRRLGGV